MRITRDENEQKHYSDYLVVYIEGNTEDVAITLHKKYKYYVVLYIHFAFVSFKNKNLRFLKLAQSVG